LAWVTKKRPNFFVWPFSSNGLFNLWAKYSEPKKQIAKILFPLYMHRISLSKLAKYMPFMSWLLLFIRLQMMI